MINLFDDTLKENNIELSQIIFENEKIMVEKIISQGEISKTDEWFDQSQDEFVILVDGYAEITYSNLTTTKLSKGDNLFIPKNVKHRVSYTSENCVWVCIFIK